MNSQISQLLNRLTATGFFSIAGSTVINKVLTFLSGILVVRILSKTDFGVYSYVYNLLNIALLFNGCGVASALIQLCSEKEDGRAQLTLERFAFLFGGGFDLLLMLALFLYASIAPEEMPGSRLLLQICSLFPLPQLVFELQCALLRSQLRNDDYARANVINTSCVVAGTIAGSLVWGAIGLLLGRVASLAASTAIIYKFFGVPITYKAIIAKELVPPLKGADRSEYVKISLSSALSNGISSFTYLIGTFMIGKLLADPVQVASYEAACAIPVALNFMPSAVMTYVYPFFARKKDDLPWVRKQYWRLTSCGLLVFGFATLVCIVLAPVIINFVYGSSYESSVDAFRVLMVGFWIGSVFRIISGNLLVTQHLVISNIISTALTVIFILLFNLILVPKYGFIGSAFAQTFGLLISGVFNTAVFCKKIYS